jgi:hypothetical protein
MAGVTLEIKLPSQRKEMGTLSIRKEDGTYVLADISALGKADSGTAAAHNNSTLDPLLPFGNTPTGTYAVKQIISTGAGTNYDADKYGPNGAIVLEPIGGDAFTAKLNGRTGLLIHAGRDRGTGKLVPTNGCIRVSNADMQRIIDAVVANSNNAAQNRCEAISITVGIGEGDPDEGYDEGDPPPFFPDTPVIFP